MAHKNYTHIKNPAFRFLKELTEYWNYAYYYGRALEKTRISGTSLGVIWWFLDPLLNMGIYIILVRFVFSQRDPNFPIFFFSAMLVWRYFSMTVSQAAGSIYSNIGVCRDIYIPKFIFPLISCMVGLNPLIVSLGILSIFMVLYKVSFTIYLLYLPFLILVLFLITFGVSMISAHIGTFMNDFPNILNHLLTLGMFATPIFYNIDRVPEKYQFIYQLNPIAVLTASFRNIMTYGTAPPLKALMFVFLLSLFIIIMAVSLLYKYDKAYNRISR